MIDILTAATMKEADQRTIDNGTPSRELMERAARAALAVLEREFDTTLVLFLCGGGNNGGDGLAMARFLAQKGGNARVLYLGSLTAEGLPDTAAMSAECARQFSLLPSEVEVCTTLKTEGVTAAVDAILGIGLTRPVEGTIRAAIEALRPLNLPVLAVDIPTGINADTGSVMGVALPAKRTVAIAAPKFGHLLYPGAGLCGNLEIADISIYSERCDGHLMEQTDLTALPERPANAHKGRFGRVLVIGGAVGMSGAAYFAAKSALRTGAGLVEILAPTDNRVIYQTQLPEALLTLYDPERPDEAALLAAIGRADAIALGMGLSQSEAAGHLVSLTLATARVPVVADADALNLLACSPELFALLLKRERPTILTPHLMEMSRISGRSIPEIAADPVANAKAFARSTGTVVVQKDARTVISDGNEIYLNAYGNSGMATGGSGDVLAGVIASLLAQGATPLDAARLGVLTHALAGDTACRRCGNHGLMASDIIDGICDVLP